MESHGFDCEDRFVFPPHPFLFSFPVLVLVYVVSPVLLTLLAFYALKPQMFHRGLKTLVSP